MKNKRYFMILLVLLMCFQTAVTNDLATAENYHSTTISESMLTEVEVKESIGAGGEEHLKANIVMNPGFERIESNGIPSDLSYGGNGFRRMNSSYQDDTYAGTYAGLLQGLGTAQFEGDAYTYRSTYDIPERPYLDQSIDLDFWYKCKANPDYTAGGSLYIRVRLYSVMGSHSLYYYLSEDSVSGHSPPYNARFDLDTTIGVWTHFQRNLTDDFETALGAMPANLYIENIYFYTSSPIDASGMAELIIDEVSMTNITSFEFFHENGDFEDGSNWRWYRSSNGYSYIYQTDDCTEGLKAANITSYSNLEGLSASTSLTAYLGEYNDIPIGYYAKEVGDFIIDFDWKYFDTLNGGAEQYATFYLYAYNGTYSMNIIWMLGDENDSPNFVSYSGSTYVYFYENATGFGTRDTWNHFSFDIFDYLETEGYENYTITSAGFNVYSGYEANSTVSLLIDDYNLVTYPTGDPTFEEDWYESVSQPYTSWSDGDDYPYNSITADAHSGNRAANITSFGGAGNVYAYRSMSLKIEENYYTDFWWRLDQIPGNDYSYAFFLLQFNTGDELYYVIGGGDGFVPSNESDYYYYFINDFNTTGVWNNLVRNVYDDLYTAFGSKDYYLISLRLQVYAQVTEITSCIFDDIHFVADTHGPEIISVDLINTPTYYEEAYIHVSAEDFFTDVEEIIIEYQEGASWIPVGTTKVEDVYVGVIPAFDYGTTVNLRIIASDVDGLETIDDNGGAYYSYDIVDDVEPLIAIQKITTASEYGLATIELDCFDAGSGIDFVVIEDNGTEIAVLDSAPYSYNWDPESKQESGVHIIAVTAHDFAGNTAADEFSVKVLVHQDPSAFRTFFHQWGTLVGAGLVGIAWVTFTIIRAVRKP